MQEVKIQNIAHKGKKRLALRFEYNSKLIALIKTIEGYKYSSSKKLWHYPNTEETLTAIKKTLQGVATITEEKLNLHPALSDEAKQKVEKFKSWMQAKRYSASTINTYIDALKAFLKFYREKPVAEITNEDVITFNNEFVLKHKLSASYQNQVTNAIKLFFRIIESTKIDIEQIHRPKTQKLLPNVLSKEEVKKILNAHSNIKHKAMLSLIYSCGLRCGELLQLKPDCIDSKRNILLIKQAKGRKDRIAPLSNKILELLRQYYTACKPSVYLFEGEMAGKPYNERSLQQVLKQALAKAGIKKPVTLHWLRHSYATHLLENGTDLRYIQEILGHSRSTTTEIYTHVSTKNIQKIVSPFDYL